MGGGNGGGGSSQDAKHVLDEFGQQVYNEKVEKDADAKTYKQALTGQLSLAKVSGVESAYTTDPCQLINDKRHELLGARGDPCGNGSGKGEDVSRFSKESGGECDEKKIKDSKSNCGACAPYRRLSLCNKNFQKINNDDSSKAKHNLLLDVCMAAEYEGESLINYHAQYDSKYPSSGSTFTMCTMLARSFADIGDIVRGRDLYLGNKKKKQTERDQLEKELKEIFEKIHSEVTRGRTNGQTLQKRYKDDPEFFKLREDWWNANRQQVWKAMTCSDRLGGNAYFRATCGGSGNNARRALSQCRCDDNPNTDPPTYFDYVPQYLRWFEEWAEDFCRKKKIYVGIVKKYCLDETKEKYCSLNGCDCTKTVRAKGKLRYGNRCTDCLFACHRYENWIDNQRKQFLKQKNKYDEEMKKYKNGTSSSSGSGGKRQTRSARGSNDNGYEKIFYEKLKGNYGTVNDFLGLLSKEKACEQITTQEEGKINFKEVNSGSTNGDGGGTSGTNDIINGTFYRSKYCQPCPICGMKKKGGKWEAKNDDKCKSGKLYEPIDNGNGTKIEILKSGENHDDIETKLKAFCEEKNGTDGSGVAGGSGGGGGGSGSKSGSQKLYEEWKCYKHDEVQKVKRQGEEEDEDEVEEEDDLKSAGGLCILKNKNKEEKKEKKSEKEPEQFQKTFYDFFTYWVAHMLKDSIHWRTKKIKSCISNGKKTCLKKCKDDCQCFQRWIDKKKTEWKEIKDHFGKQEDFKNEGQSGEHKMLGEGMESPDFVLGEFLELQFLNENNEGKSENSLDAQEAEELKHLQKILKQDEQNTQQTAGGANGKKNIMDKLIDYEKDEAEKCKKIQEECEKKKQQRQQEEAARARGRSDTGTSRDTQPRSKEVEDEEEEEEEEEEETETQAASEEEEETATQEEPPAEALPTQEDPKVCNTVKSALEGNLDDACALKYVTGKNYGWRCVAPSGTTSDTTTGSESAGPTRRVRSAEPAKASGTNQGSICVPPRRRRLYIGKIKEWADKHNTEASSEATLSSPSHLRDVDLRNAFIQSAAVETFFLWDRYKKVKNKEIAEKKQREAVSLLFNLSGLKDGSEENKTPHELLNSGKIPDGFLRQMFYTLGDYRDILFGKNDILIQKTSSGASDKEMADRERKIKETIDKVFPNNDSSSAPRGTSLQNGDTPPSDQQRENLWSTFAKDIWNGMICALTYKESDKKPTDGTSAKIDRDEEVKTKLFDENGTSNDPIETYKYDKVVLKEENSGTEDPKPTSAASSGDNNPPKTTLKDFVLRPTYFRYLEEWGETFCRERKKRLEKIEGDCRVEDGSKNCSGYGEHCDDQLDADPTNVSDLKCQSCGEECRKYKKWIERKKYEFTEQQNAYEEQKTKCHTQSNGAGPNNDGKRFCVTLNTYSKAGDFLQTLKNGPCKKDSGENSAKDNKIFDEKGDTFQHTNLCDPCSEFKINCENGKCSDEEKRKCNRKNTIDAKNIESMKTNTQDVVMRVSDNSKKDFESDLKDACKNAGIFKGIRKDQWKCGKFCGYVVCKLETDNEEKVNGRENQNKIITIRALVTHWVHNFLEDYNRIKHRISHCMEKGEEPKCIKECVEKWISTKKDEWTKIKKIYLQQYENKAQPDYPVKTILEEFKDRPEFKNAIKPCGDLNAFKKSCGLNGDESSEKNKEGTKEDNDLVLCLIDRLDTKIKKCETHHSGDTGKNCVDTPTPLFDDYEEENEEENEKKVGHPTFCKIEEETKKVVEKETCDAPPAEEEKKEEEKEKGNEQEEAISGPAASKPEPAAGTDVEQTPVQDQAPEDTKEERPVKPAQPQPPSQQPRHALEHPAVIPSLVTSTLAWSVGIGFAAFTYFYLKCYKLYYIFNTYIYIT
ncbi:hypothetical protein C923_04154 [Plasmodium falciparum UGT5.1]|uniref:Duffy-binding-like domain-containing protein n=1 Tax=Plasmodium falciparum UGT5.1 TaxID=1237627 RepID=W7J843_PLAFA|nr:hypothetical protein C923_04154 [Plasmodium falciparum UGT5.1]